MTVKTAAVFISITAIVTILMFFKSFLQPLVVALLLWFVIVEMRAFLIRLKLLKKPLPRLLLTFISTALVFVIFYACIQIIIVNIEKLTENFDQYSANLVALLKKLEKALNLEDLGQNLMNQKKDILASVAGAAASLASLLGKMFLVFFYVVFILLEEVNFKNKLEKMYHMSEENRMKKTWDKIYDLMHDYLSVKLLTSFLTGILSFFILLFIGIDLPALWAFIIFILNFIPSIGSIIATSFPVIFAYVQSGNLRLAGGVLIGILAVQVFIGNVLEPRLMGNRLNLSPLVVMVGLVFWGFIWGIMGMLLSVPIMASLMIVFSQFPNTKRLAIFLSQDGNIESLLEGKKDQKKKKD
ncbi:MAG: AI-2E family transporter [Cyclobacteriaceae bacterium]|nr:AI-2E family transporter [Cyclobacteriaceae bacterium]